MDLKNNFNRKNRGFGLIEIVLGVSILSLVIVSAYAVSGNALRLNRLALDQVEAGFLSIEGAEAFRFLRDRDFAYLSGLSTTTDYYLTWTSGNWATTTTVSSIDGKFYRKARITDVFRDASDDIAESGTHDPDTKKVRIETAWKTARFGTTTKSVELYLTKI